MRSHLFIENEVRFPFVERNASFLSSENLPTSLFSDSFQRIHTYISISPKLSLLTTNLIYLEIEETSSVRIFNGCVHSFCEKTYLVHLWIHGKE